VQLLHLGKLSRPKCHNLALNCWFFQCYNSIDINCNTVTILFYLHILQLTVYNRIITRFIAEDKVVYQRVRQEMWLASDKSWTWRRLEHVSRAGDAGELSCAHLNGEWQFHAKSHELTGAFLACPPDWAQGPPLVRDERGLPLPGCWTVVPVLRILFSRLLVLPSFQPLSGNSLNSLCAPYCFDR